MSIDNEPWKQAAKARMAFLEALCELDASFIIAQLSAALDEIRHDMQDDEDGREAIWAALQALLNRKPDTNPEPTPSCGMARTATPIPHADAG